MGFVGEKTPNDQCSMCGGVKAAAAVDGPAESAVALWSAAIVSTCFLAAGLLSAEGVALLDEALPPCIEPGG